MSPNPPGAEPAQVLPGRNDQAAFGGRALVLALWAESQYALRDGTYSYWSRLPAPFERDAIYRLAHKLCHEPLPPERQHQLIEAGRKIHAHEGRFADAPPVGDNMELEFYGRLLRSLERVVDDHYRGENSFTPPPKGRLIVGARVPLGMPASESRRTLQAFTDRLVQSAEVSKVPLRLFDNDGLPCDLDAHALGRYLDRAEGKPSLTILMGYNRHLDPLDPQPSLYRDRLVQLTAQADVIFKPLRPHVVVTTDFVPQLLRRGNVPLWNRDTLLSDDDAAVLEQLGVQLFEEERPRLLESLALHGKKGTSEEGKKETSQADRLRNLRIL
ncbi:hypothetical protein ACN2MM_14170 [Alkalilimnicola ehrlichii MLHE-1]|uniref:Uncharacterized protein n=1 Tax=Alkalilimnicola ehrlichii (strain ATCC BAA-1101 / DSM 17681 / MLHE-1) TaxID=187272 RepID=Q0A570_ALKEH|nr:hypothetical protein [Alkalilimnicola ehrlichii]ABI58017.1 hypothetical protein Mlg_2677 [Alkalilimnicola ehrlichii MLHE-1]